MQILILKNTHYAMDEEMKNLIGDVEVDDFVLLENLNSKRLTSLNVLSPRVLPSSYLPSRNH